MTSKPLDHVGADLVFDAPEGRNLQYATKRVGGVPAVGLRLWFGGGSRAESIPGLASITGRLLSEGTSGLDWQALATRFEEHGMALATFGTQEAHGITVDALAPDWRVALEWLAEVALDSTFPSDRCDWLKSQAISELQSLGDQPETKTAWAFQDQLYHPHPLARPSQGTEEGLRSLGSQDCLEFHQRAQKQGAYLTVAGDIDPGEVAAAIELIFADLDQPLADRATVVEPVGREQRRALVETDAHDQSHLYLGHLTVGIDHADLAALQVAGVVLGAGSGLTGRIPERVREQEGLAYSAQASTLSGAGLDVGRLAVYVGTSPESAAQAEIAVREELARFVEHGPDDKEVRDAKAFLLGREPFRRETARQWADLLADALFYRLPIHLPHWRRERIENVDRTEVCAAVRRHLHPEALYVTLGEGAKR